MFRRTDRRQGTAKRGRDVRGSRTHTGPISIHHRRLLCEALEDRCLLAMGGEPLPSLGTYEVGAALVSPTWFQAPDSPLTGPTLRELRLLLAWRMRAGVAPSGC